MWLQCHLNELQTFSFILLLRATVSSNHSYCLRNRRSSYIISQAYFFLGKTEFPSPHSDFDLRDLSETVNDHVELLGLDSTANFNFGRYIEGLANTTLKNFTPSGAAQLLDLDKEQVRSCMEHCYQVWHGFVRYLTAVLDWVEQKLSCVV